MIRIGLLAVILAVATPAMAQSSPATPKTKKSTKTKRKVVPRSDLAKRIQTHLERGIEFYAEKQYELAIVEFRAGFALDPRPDFLFALAQAERLSGDCPSAVVYYRRFLETKPGENQAEAARVNMKRCDRALESGPMGRPEKPTPAKLQDAEGIKETPRPMPHSHVPALVSDSHAHTMPWYRDTVGSALLVGGVLALGVGSGFWVASSSAETAAKAAPTLDGFRSQMDLASSRRAISVASLAVSAGLVAAGVLRLVLRGRSSSKSSARLRAPARQLVATPAQSGAVIGLVGRF